MKEHDGDIDQAGSVLELLDINMVDKPWPFTKLEKNGWRLEKN